MRDQGEEIIIDQPMMDAMAFAFANKGRESIIGLAVDIREKIYYQSKFNWTPTGGYDPFDTTDLSGLTYDFKVSVDGNTVTLQGSECLYADTHPGNYNILLYLPVKHPRYKFVGAVKYEQLKEFLEPSQFDPPPGRMRSKFARIEKIQHLICK
jgi:hypothetical protein